MLIGFNNDVEFEGRMFHIQTEDHGIKDGHITTILFFSGQILDSKKISYQEDVEGVSDEEAQKKAIKKRMVTLHREFYKRLFDGDYSKRVEKIASEDKGKPKPAKPDSKGKPKGKPAKLDGLKPPSDAAKRPPPLKGPPPKPDVKGPPPLRPPPTAKPLKPSVAKGLAAIPKAKPPTRQSSAPSANAPDYRQSKARAFRGLRWPDDDMRLDGLVATFLDSVEQ